MGRDVLSVRQMMVLLVVGLLAPAADLLPTVAARQVGRGGWLVVLGALPLLLLAVWACGKVFSGRGPCAAVGKPVGYTIIIMYLIWVLFGLAVVLRLSAARLEIVYSKVPPFLFAAALAALAAWMGMGKVSALARAAEVFYLALSVVLAGVLLLALFNVEWKNLWPVEWERLPSGSIRAAGILLTAAPAAVMGAHVPKGARSARSICGWVTAFCLVVTLVLAAVLGSVGSGLSAHLDIPYLIMVQGLGVKGAFQRTEALIAAVWLLSDLVFAGVLLRSWREYAAQLVPEKWCRRSVPAAAAAALAGGWLLFPQESGAQLFCQTVLSVAGVVLGLMMPTLLWLMSLVRSKRNG